MKRLALGLLGLSLGGVLEAQTIQIPASSVMQRRVVKNKAVYFADEVTLQPHQELVFDEPATVFVDSLDLQKNSRIDTNGNKLELFIEEEFDADQATIDVSEDANYDTSGADGDHGVDGSKAADALKGGAGAAGAHASHGVHGGDAEPITVISPIIRGNIILLARGGNGGSGGNGGEGGKGGEGFSGMDARTLYYFRGMENLGIDQLLNIGTMIGVPYVGQVLAILSIFNGIRIGDGFDGFDGGAGGAGGNAGNGGNGGHGGAIELIFGKQVDGTKILVSTRGGKGGAAGRPGTGGVGGAGGVGGQRGDIWSREGKPGNSGAPGAMGLAGLSGTSGRSGKIKAIQTDDPHWVKCYVQYREILDLDDDREFAREMFRMCTASGS